MAHTFVPTPICSTHLSSCVFPSHLPCSSCIYFQGTFYLPLRPPLSSPSLIPVRGNQIQLVQSGQQGRASLLLRLDGKTHIVPGVLWTDLHVTPRTKMECLNAEGVLRMGLTSRINESIPWQRWSCGGFFLYFGGFFPVTKLTERFLLSQHEFWPEAKF